MTRFNRSVVAGGNAAARMALAAMLATFALSAQDFRGLVWGASPADVVKREGREPDRVDDANHGLVYKVAISGIDSMAIYLFDTADGSPKLVHAGYTVIQKHSGPEGFVSDFTTIYKDLTAKYGEPVIDRLTWHNNTLNDSDQGHFAMAVSLGQVEGHVTWDTPTTHIVLSLSGDNHEVTVLLTYASRQYLERKDGKAKTDSAF